MNNNYTTYKDSLLGKIPSDWEVKHFEDVADIDNESLNGVTSKDYEFDQISLSDVDSDDLKIETTKEVFANAPSKRTAEKGIDAGVADGEEKITDIDCKGTIFCARYITTEIMNNYNPNIHHRRSIRLKGYDYSKAGLYFITICVQDRKCLFGKIVAIENFQRKMVLNDAGNIADACWLEIPKHFPNVVLHEHIVMPKRIGIKYRGSKFYTPPKRISKNHPTFHRINYPGI